MPLLTRRRLLALAGAVPPALLLPGARGRRAMAATDPQAGFRRAEGTRAWAFPRDHGQHPAYRLEWWYYTGIVAADGGRRFGYQATIFRQGVAGADPQRPSAWAVQSLYLAHAAVSDLAGARYLHASRAGRDSLGLAGAARDAHTVWLGAWRADALPDDPHGVRLALEADAFALALTLRGDGPAARGPVLHGAGGLDRKGPQPGQASWYYSLPRLATAGTLRLDGTAHAVRGVTWMDHEFGTSQLAPDLAGWDWLALRLDDGRDLMLYRLRHADGTPDAFSSGSLVARDGTRTALTLTGDGPRRAAMTPGRTWRSEATGGEYPVEWRVALPDEALELRVAAAFDAQEQTPAPGTPFAYWEGVVTAEGTAGGRPLRGEGYLELTGYAGRLGGALREG